MLVNRIYQWAHEQPAKAALILSGGVLEYLAFARAIERTRRLLEPLHLPVGGTAVILAHDLRLSWIFVLASRAIGLNTICVQSLSALDSLQIRHPACVLVSALMQPHERFDREGLQGTRVVVVPAETFDHLDEGDLPALLEGAGNFGGHILYTSGTTGTYKKVLEHGNREEDKNKLRADLFGFARTTVFHALSFGLWTVAGFGMPAAVWFQGGTVVFDSSPQRFENFYQHGVNEAFLAPPMVGDLLGVHGSSSISRADVNLAVGGGFLSLSSAKAVLKHLAGSLVLRYGSTECSVVLNSRFRSDDDLFWLSPVRQGQLAIVDEQGREVSDDVEGELRVRLTPLDATEYLDDPQTSAQYFRDGYFYPGDMAVRRADGRIRIVGRATDVLNLQGRKVAPAPIEQKIEQLLGSRSVCLFTGLDRRGREELVIAVEGSQPLEPSASEQIAQQFRYFESVRFVLVQEFPRTGAGMQKIDRIELRKRL